MMVIRTPDAGADCPDVSILFRMFSTLVAVSDVQFAQALRKQSVTGVPVHESKKPAGKSVKLVQLRQAELKFVPFDTSINGPLLGGNLVSPELPNQAPLKLVPLDVSISGKLYCSPNYFIRSATCCWPVKLLF